MNWNSSVTNEEWELIDRYLDGELPEGELRQFEQRLLQDAEWKEKTESCRLIRIGIAEAGLSEKINEWNTGKKKQDAAEGGTRPAAIRPLLKWAVAACLVVALSVGAWWWNSRPGANEKTYLAFYQPDPGLLTVMGPADAYQFEQAMVHYKAGEYAEAVAAWEALKNTYPAADTLHYFIASAWQAQQQWDKAEANYLVVVKDNNSPLYKEACWYLGLLYLHNSRLDEARKWIEQSSHPRRAELLKALND